MTLRNITRAVALSALATFGTMGAASAAICNISMPASGGNAEVAAVNANIVNVLQTQYPDIEFDAPSATQSSSVTVPNCVGSDFAPTGANVSNVTGATPAGAGTISQQGAAGAAALALALIVIFNSSSTTTSTTGNP